MAARAAVARSGEDLADGSVVLVGCSGGPDSLALAGCAAWVGNRQGWVVRAVVVDHALQQGSADVAAAAAAACTALGVPADVVRVEVGTAGGPEAAARDARYAALGQAADEAGAAAVLLGHTLDDQAETVLLRLARGSGARTLSAMSARAGRWRRPFLPMPRAAVHAVAVEMLEPLGITSWTDPHNSDPSFARVRVRSLLAGLGADLGPGVVQGLARSADLLRDDADALDAIAGQVATQVMTVDAVSATCHVDDLAALPTAVRTRVIRAAALAMGCPADGLALEHVRRIDALITDWRGQGDVALPGGVVARRGYGRLSLIQGDGAETGVPSGA